MLFAAAFLSTHRNIDHRGRLGIMARISPFDIDSVREAGNALAEAFTLAEVQRPRDFPKDRLSTAASLAKGWIEKNIFVMSRENLAAPGRFDEDFPETVFAFGDPSIALSGTAAILNSRKHRRLTAADSWITATRCLVEYAQQRKLTLVSSYGTIPYCTVSRLAQGKPLIIVCDEILPFLIPRRDAQFASQYGDLFQRDRTLFVSSFPPGSITPPGMRSRQRDRLVAALGSVLLIAEIRQNGNMERVVQRASARNKEILRYPRLETGKGCPPATESSEPSFEQNSRECSSEAENPAKNSHRLPFPGSPSFESKPRAQLRLVPIPVLEECFKEKQSLIHFTRSCPGPWPGQTMADYCQSLIEGCPRSAHTAFDTLYRILQENVIRATSRLTRRGHCAVSLTECSPAEIAILTRWRRGLIRWSFEPYGIAFPKEVLFSRGARPVIYAVEEAFQDLSPDLQYLFQPQGRSRIDWSGEKEWRVRGDLVLTEDLRQTMVAIVPAHEEAEVIAHEFGCRVAISRLNAGEATRNCVAMAHK